MLVATAGAGERDAGGEFGMRGFSCVFGSFTFDVCFFRFLFRSL